MFRSESEPPCPHTPTPWAIDGEAFVSIVHEGDAIADLSDSPFDCEQDHANAARIVACVNACEGIDDPAATLAEVREKLGAIAHILEYVPPVLESKGATVTAFTVRDEVSKLRGLLTKLGPKT
jgi:hypothetical protein